MSRRLNIQSITSGYRPICDGSLYDQYFPDAKMTKRYVVKSRGANVEDVVLWMQKVVAQWYKDAEQIAPELKGNTLLQTIINIWEFLYHHIQYKLDTPGLEELRRLARSWADRETGIDCDDFSIAASSILTVLNIPHSLRITKYEESFYQHVYVIVPHPSGYYIIDPVLSKSNYEKPFTEKADFMSQRSSLNGINVAILEGFGSAEDSYLKELLYSASLEGLGSANEKQNLLETYNYLVAIRRQISSNPDSIRLIENPSQFVQMLDYAIKYWNTPKREEAIRRLAEMEAELNQFNGIDGFSGVEDNQYDIDWSELEGMSGRQIRQYLSEIQSASNDQIGRIFKRKKRKNPKGRKRSFFNKLKTTIKNGIKTVVKYSPLVIAARNGFLLAMKVNLFKLAERIKWGYATQAQIRGKVSPEYWRNAQKAVKVIEDRFVNRLGGKRTALRKAILKGKSGGLSGSANSYFAGGIPSSGIGEPVTMTALLASASTVIAWAASMIKKHNLNKEGDPSPEQIKNSLDSKNANLPSQESTVAPNYDPNAVEPLSTEVVEPSNEMREYSSITPESDEQSKGKLKNFYEKNKTLVWIGGGALTLAGGLYGLYRYKNNKKNNKQEGSLKGTTNSPKKSKTSTNTRKTNSVIIERLK